MQKVTYFTLLFTLIFFFGCGEKKRSVVAPQKALPSWYKSPPLSNEEELYALGEGQNREDAIANALNMMASTLSVSLSSDFRAKTVVQEGRNNSVDALYENDVKSSVKELRISNYEILDAQSLGFKKYAVLLKSNKKQLFTSMLQETNQEFSLLDEKEKNLEGANGIKKLVFYKEAKNSLVNLPNRLIVMSVLESSFDGTMYMQKLQAYDGAYESLLKGLTFLVTTSKNANNLQRVIEKGLSKEKINIATDGEENMHFHVHIDANIQEANSYGFSLARSEINIVTKDSDGTAVGANRLSIIGQSSQGYEVAKQNLAIKLDELVKKEGIARVLGLSI
jgi:hypothetical protein